MSIRFEVKNKNESKTVSFDIGYITFFKFRQTLATMVDEMAGYVYGRYIHSQFTFLPDSILKVSPSEWGYFKLKTPPVLQKFLLASDCGGKLTPKECDRLYSILTEAVEKTDKTKLDKKFLQLFDDFSKCLLYATEHKTNLVWY